MATSFTLATLKTAITGTLADTGTAFAAVLDRLIQQAEDKVLGDLDLTIFDSWQALAFSSGQHLVNYPTGTIKMREAYYTAGSVTTPLEERTAAYLIDFWPNTSTTTTTPRFWAPYSETQFRVAGTPGASPSAGTALCMIRPNSLVTDTGGSWLSKYAGTLLLHACLVESEKFNVSDERLAMWKGEYAESLATARHEFRHLMRHDYTPLASTPSPKGEQ